MTELKAKNFLATSRWSVEVILEVSEKSEVIDLSLHISWREITNSDDQTNKCFTTIIPNYNMREISENVTL